MSDEAKKYNGWANYETWCVHLWLTNEEGSYRYWREEAIRHREEAPSCANVSEGIWSVDLSERAGLADQLKSELEEASPIEEASLFSDLLNAALSEVDWHEVAEAFLEELDPEDRPEQGDADEKTDQPDEDDEEAYSAEEFERVKRERVEKQKEPLFELGQVVSTPGALDALTAEDIGKALARHHRGDWGDVGRHDWRANEEALTEGFRLFSVYRSESSVKFWVITEADRSSTCVLLPEEY
jgi:hypothetical protein